MNSLICANFSSVMLTILYVFIAIMVLLTMVLIHELGHYVAGRILGFKILEFSIGFGKVIWQKTNKRGEKISLRLFPLGGFCAFDGEGENDDEQETSEVTEDKSADKNTITVNEDLKNTEQKIDVLQKENSGKFNDQKPWKRIIVFLAGVTFNFLSAFIFAIIFLCVAGYDASKITPTQGYNVNYYSTQTGQVLGTLNPSDDYIVYAVDGVKINFAKTNTFAKLTSTDKEQVTLTLSINGGEIQDIVIKKESYPVEVDGKTEYKDLFGLTLVKNVNKGYSFWDVLRDFIPFTFELSVLILSAFWQIITGKVSLNNLGGPVTTITQMTQIASYGVSSFLYLLPMLAANLAIFNILPFPGLDGSHVVFTTIEWIRGKPIKRSVENAIHAWGIILLFAFVIIIDIIHLVS